MSTHHESGEDQARLFVQQARDIHARMAAGKAGTADIIAPAARLAELLAEILAAIVGGDGVEKGRIKTPANLFQALEVARGRIADSPLRTELQKAFEEIEAHGRYLAGKQRYEFASFLKGAPVRNDACEGDAVLNTCSVLQSLIERAGGFRDIADGWPSGRFPDWLSHQLNDLARIEPRLGLQLDYKEPFEFKQAGRNNPYDRCFEENRNVLEPRPVVVISFAWLKRGGAEIYGAKLVRAAQEAVGVANVLVMVLDYDVVEAKEWFPAGTRFFFAARDASYLSRDQRVYFVRQYLANMQPSVVLNCNSSIMWDIYRDFGQPLAATSKLKAALFCFDYTKQGTPVGYAASHLPDALAHLDSVYLDNAAFKAALSNLFAFPEPWREKLHVLYYPLDSTALSDTRGAAPRKPARRPKALWASRICRQKRPELLLSIAQACPAWDFEVYGDFYEHDYKPSDFHRDNVRYRGEFGLIQDLPDQDFDAFLYTSLWDGLPTILLGAALLGLPIVAPAVGGIPELVNNERGWLVRDHEDPRSYGRALNAVVDDPATRARRIQAMIRYVSEAHSAAAYAGRLKELGIFDV